MFLTRVSVSQPVFATMVMVAMMVIGAFSYSRLPIERFPDIDFPIVAVVTAYPGASPEAVESDIVKPIEDAVATVAGLDKVRSNVQPGSSLVIIQFQLEVESAAAAQDVRDKIDQIRSLLPDNAGDPLILRFDPAALPVVSVGVSSEVLDAGALTALTEDVIAKRLANVRGVGRASVVGGSPREVQVDVDPDRLTALGVGIGEVAGALSAQNQDLPAGAIESAARTTAVQVEGRVETLYDFQDVIVAQRGGQPIRLGDIATVRDRLAAPESLAMVDGVRALSIDVVKTQGANTVAVAKDVAAEVAKMSADPAFEDVTVEILVSNAEEIIDSFESVQNMIIEGAFLATVIVFLFLNSWRSTVITGLTLPISIIGTMTAIWALGFTLNMMTLMALSLVVGILIDDAIVVRENIMRHLAMGKSHRRAALDGTNEIGLAVLATTLSIVAVFLPVAFMTGIIGRFFLQFGITVSVAVMISLFVSFTLDPMLSSVWYDPAAKKDARRGPIGRLVAQFDRFFEWVAARYADFLKRALKFRKTTLAVAAAAFVGGLALFPIIGAEFVPAADTGRVQVDLQLPVGTTIDRAAEKIAQVEALLKREYPEIAESYATLNSGTQRGGTAATLLLTLSEDRSLTPQEMVPDVRTTLAAIPGVGFTVGAPNGFGGVEKPVSVSIIGPDNAVLARLSAELAEKLKQIRGLVEVDTSLDDPQPTLAIRLDRDLAAEFGVSPDTVGNTLYPMLAGQNVTEWTSPGGENFDVVLRLPLEARDDPELLGALPLATQAGIVRLDQIATVVESTSPGEIKRENRDRAVSIRANLEGLTLGEVQADIQAAMDSLTLPVGYRISSGGEAEDMQESMISAMTALGLAVIFIYLVLASQFASFLQPFAIMSSLPLALVGVMLGLLAFGSTLNIYSIIGFIMLMGLVTKNAILLVDNANQRVREGMNLYDALVRSGATRFRPIVMTTLAMIFGMLPLALNLHGGTGENASMAHAVIGGLISSSILTLVVVPVLLTYTDAFGKWISRYLPSAPDDAHSEASADG